MAKNSVATSTPVHSISSADADATLMQPALVEEPATPIVARPCCTQCGKTLRHLPLFLGNITCRECYGAERYQRGPGIPIGASSLTAPVRDNTYTA
jgi:hypothetical protein